MNIRELFQNLQEENFIEQLKGELVLIGNCIIWSYDLKDNNDEEISDDNDFDDDFDFNTTSTAELLQEAYDEDFQAIEALIDELNEYSNWSFSPSEVGDTSISFKIF
jgi:hypothetical protein